MPNQSVNGRPCVSVSNSPHKWHATTPCSLAALAPPRLSGTPLVLGRLSNCPPRPLCMLTPIGHGPRYLYVRPIDRIRTMLKIIGTLQIAAGVAIIAFSVAVMGGVLINGLLLFGFGLLLLLDGVRTLRKRAITNDIHGTLNSVGAYTIVALIVWILCLIIAKQY